MKRLFKESFEGSEVELNAQTGFAVEERTQVEVAVTKGIQERQTSLSGGALPHPTNLCVRLFFLLSHSHQHIYPPQLLGPGMVVCPGFLDFLPPVPPDCNPSSLLLWDCPSQAHGSDPVRLRNRRFACRGESKLPKGTFRALPWGLKLPWAHLSVAPNDYHPSSPCTCVLPHFSYLVTSSGNLFLQHHISTYHLSSKARFKYPSFHEVLASQKILDFTKYTPFFPLHSHSTLFLTSLTTLTSLPHHIGSFEHISTPPL